MPIQVECVCGRRLRARDELAGKRSRCPACNAIVQIPALPMPDRTPRTIEETFPASAPDRLVARQPAKPPQAATARVASPAMMPAPAPRPARVVPQPPPPPPAPEDEVDPDDPFGPRDPYALADEPDEPQYADPAAEFSSIAFPAPAPQAFPAAPPPPPAAALRRSTLAAAPALARRPVAAAAVAQPEPEHWAPRWLAEPASPVFRTIQRYAYLVLALAIIPLMVQTFLPHETSRDRFSRTFRAHPEVLKHILEDEADGSEVGVARIMSKLPDGRLDGAHLPYNTNVHYLYALLSATLFFGLGLFIMPAGATKPLHVFLVGLFTGTIGIVLLLVLQFLASHLAGRIIIPRSIIGIVFLLVQLIGWSYRAALDPSSSFIGSFLGFTFGVGFCEEACKALPVIWNVKTRASLDWRAAFLWGLLSGVGFGVSEGITYAANYYNGIDSGGIYLVRFISCVALHGTWSAAAAVSIYRRQNLIQDAENLFNFLIGLLVVIAVPMLLHGLYDTLLKKDMTGGALIIAILSVAYLAFEVESIHRKEEKEILPAFA
jgi:RsiW-degrading membrane proteinase PrsW (M82 family)